MSSRGEHEESGRAGPDGGRARELRIGVVLEAFLDWPLDRVLAWLPEAAPEITDIEVGAGGYAPHPHCDVAGLLASAPARAAWLDQIARHGLRLDCLNAWGNPLHPDPDLARQHDEDLRNAIRLAALLGADRVVAMAGCPVPGRAGAGCRTSPRAAGCPTWRVSTSGSGSSPSSRTGPGWPSSPRPKRPTCGSAWSCTPGRARSTWRRSAGSPRSGRRSAPTSIPATSSGWAWTGTG